MTWPPIKSFTVKDQVEKWFQMFDMSSKYNCKWEVIAHSSGRSSEWSFVAGFIVLGKEKKTKSWILKESFVVFKYYCTHHHWSQYYTLCITIIPAIYSRLWRQTTLNGLNNIVMHLLRVLICIVNITENRGEHKGAFYTEWKWQFTLIFADTRSTWKASRSTLESIQKRHRIYSGFRSM